MLLKIRPEFHCLEGEHQKTDVYKNSLTRNPVWKDKIRIPVLIKIAPEYQ